MTPAEGRGDLLKGTVAEELIEWIEEKVDKRRGFIDLKEGDLDRWIGADLLRVLPNFRSWFVVMTHKDMTEAADIWPNERFGGEGTDAFKVRRLDRRRKLAELIFDFVVKKKGRGQRGKGKVLYVFLGGSAGEEGLGADAAFFLWDWEADRFSLLRSVYHKPPQEMISNRLRFIGIIAIARMLFSV